MMNESDDIWFFTLSFHYLPLSLSTLILSTSHALFSLKETVNYFTRNNSRVYLSFLDCSKAFDRISHWGLFIKLIKCNVPLCFLMSVMYLYMNMSCTVKWSRSMSRAFEIPAGTKQGGILSPDFFALYMHDLIEILKSSGFGCLVIQVCIACLFFADDLVLLSPSRYGLQQLLDNCATVRIFVSTSMSRSLKL